MSTYRQLVYMCLDELKITSDDSHFTKEHVIFLLNNYRVLLLKQRYSDIKKEIPDSNYQTLCIKLQPVEDACGGSYLKSEAEIPSIVPIASPRISTSEFFKGNFNYISNERFKYVGFNRFLSTQPYATIAPDHHLYLRSGNPQMMYLESVKLTGIFEDTGKAAALSCSSKDICDLMDMSFPIEDSLTPYLVEMVVKELSGAKLQPKDTENNAADDLSDIATFLRTNVKSPLAKQLS